ncbi:MAG: cytochrome C oxidase subunit IV family protein [Motiliproteus sp.]|nr:cytochrome C oxidase subunit IV family protein [Motiliproteus sp.]MCW9051320.1 cytochrome C oxidase subunit IV family protein [Motiliproteus sp.]
MPTYRLSTILWLVMLALTCIAAYFAEQPQLSLTLIGVVLFITVIKAAMIVDYFMCLRDAPLFWRGLLMAYVPLVSLIITATYAIDFS